MFLYLLAFKDVKDEPLIKVGISKTPISRWKSLDAARFDFHQSHLVEGRPAPYVQLLERNLKVLFDEARRDVAPRLSSGNTETFCSGVLPAMLDFVRACQGVWPQASLALRSNLSGMLPAKAAPQATPPAEPTTLSAAQLRRRDAKQARQRTQHAEKHAWGNRNALGYFHRVAPRVRFLRVSILADCSDLFELRVEVAGPLDEEAREKGWAIGMLCDLGRLHLLYWDPEPMIEQAGVMTTEPAGDGLIAHVRFDLATLRHIQARTPVPDPTPAEALAFWRNLVERFAP